MRVGNGFAERTQSKVIIIGRDIGSQHVPMLVFVGRCTAEKKLRAWTRASHEGLGTERRRQDRGRITSISRMDSASAAAAWAILSSGCEDERVAFSMSQGLMDVIYMNPKRGGRDDSIQYTKYEFE